LFAVRPTGAAGENGGGVPTERKIALVAELKELIEASEVAIATSYQGMPVTEQTLLRRQLRESGVTLRIVKNSLLLRAADEAGRAHFAQLADGPTALVTHPDDPVAAARAVATWGREHQDTALAVRNAVIGDEVVDAAYIADLATVPTREVLLGRLAGGLTAKVTELVLLLQSATRELAGLIDARAQQLEESEG
jgi:large subunit ribosomal protein L10